MSSCSPSIGVGSSSQAQKPQTQVGSDSADSAGATGGDSASATGTAGSVGQAVAGYEPGQIPPIPMISLTDLSLLTQSTGVFTPDLTRSITSQPGVTVRPARCDASGSLVSGSTVLGGHGSMTTSSGSTSVTNLAAVLKDSKAPKVQIQGHTDSVSDDASNRILSEQRAKAVTEALTSNGVTASIESVGYGETRPVAPNENPDGSDNPGGRRLNRRVDVFVPAF